MAARHSQDLVVRVQSDTFDVSASFGHWSHSQAAVRATASNSGNRARAVNGQWATSVWMRRFLAKLTAVAVRDRVANVQAASASADKSHQLVAAVLRNRPTIQGLGDPMLRSRPAAIFPIQ
jgi:hypothetical protein